MKYIGLFSILWCAASVANAQQSVASTQTAKKHALVYKKPAPSFFEGALLGNGGMGAVVCTRPDAVVIYFGHNNVWDIRLAEDYKQELGTFQSVFDQVKVIPADLAHLSDNPWYSDHLRKAGSNYGHSYPRPFPCGSMVLGFDRRKTELIGHTLDISSGTCTIKFLTKANEELLLEVYMDMEEDRLVMKLVNNKGVLLPNFFDRIRLMADPSTPGEFPRRTETELLEKGILSFRQVLPSGRDGKLSTSPHSPDKAFRLQLNVNGSLHKKDRMNWSGNMEPMASMEAAIGTGKPFLASVQIEEGMNAKVSNEPLSAESPSSHLLSNISERNFQHWNEYWGKSSVQLEDDFLEEVWYRNLYFFNCATKEGATTPGIFANWSYNNIGTAWHGDYHMNYNTQQPFWVTFSSNHLEKNLSYVNLIESLLPVSKQWAKEYYELPGAYFPHSAYPVKMTMNPYPLPDWGWEICETPWAVQGLWWHYLYSGDTAFLRNRAYPPMKEAVKFIIAYMNRPEARGGERWKDDKFHIFPSVPPELYGLRPGFKYNYDCTADLALTKFLFKAFSEASSIMGSDKEDEQPLSNIRKILSRFPEYPTAVSEAHGEVIVSVPEEHAQVVHNVPNPLFSVFPGEQHGLHSPADTVALLKRTYYNQRNEGGNDLVFINLQAARMGLLDIEAFKRHVNYCMLPNGTSADKVLQTMGRYNDASDFNYMGNMGIWFENFALPAVINECLMQSYNGTIHLFPNWPKEKDATFTTLRAAGAFLVSATQRDGKIERVEIVSEKGNELRVVLPWEKYSIFRDGKKEKGNGKVLRMKTGAGERIVVVKG